MSGSFRVCGSIYLDVARCKIVLRMIRCLFFIMLVTAGLSFAAVFLLRQIHHLTVVVMVYAHCYHGKDDSKSNHDDG